MNHHELRFQGPYGWTVDRTIPLVYDLQPAVESNGVYLHTILTPEGDELVCYVGETGRSFSRRFQEEEASLLDGSERIFEPYEYSKGVKIRLWGGKWARYRERGDDVAARFDRLGDVVGQFLSIHRLHFAPISEGPTSNLDKKEFRLRAEAALAHHFYMQGGIVGGFQEGDVVYLHGSNLPRTRLESLVWPPQDATTHIICRTNAKIRCFPTEIVV